MKLVTKLVEGTEPIPGKFVGEGQQLYPPAIITAAESYFRQLKILGFKLTDLPGNDNDQPIEDLNALIERVEAKLDKSVFEYFKNTELPRNYVERSFLIQKLNEKVDLLTYQSEIDQKASKIDLDKKVNTNDFNIYKKEQTRLLNAKASSQDLVALKQTLVNDYLTKSDLDNKLDLKVDKSKLQEELDKKMDKVSLTGLVKTSEFNTFKTQIQTDVDSRLTQADKTELVSAIDTKFPKSEFNAFQSSVFQQLNTKLGPTDKTELESKINTKIGQQEYQSLRDEVNVLKSGKKEFGAINKSKVEVDADLTLLTAYVRDILQRPNAPMVDGYSVNTNDGYSYVFINSRWTFNGQDIIHNATLTTPGTIKLSTDKYKAGDGGAGTLKINGLTELDAKVTALEAGKVSLDANNTFTGLNTFNSNLKIVAEPTADDHAARFKEVKSLESKINRKFTEYTSTANLNVLLNDKASVSSVNEVKVSLEAKADKTALNTFATKDQFNQVSSNITRLETSKADKNDLDSAVAEINTLKTEKASKVDHDTLKSRVDALSAGQVTSAEFNTFKTSTNQSLATKVSVTDYNAALQAMQPQLEKIPAHTNEISTIKTRLDGVKKVSDTNKSDLDNIKNKVALLEGSVITLGGINKTRAEVEANKQLLTDRVTELGKALVANIVLLTSDKAEFIYNGTTWEFLKQDGVELASTTIAGVIKFNAGNALGSVVAGPNGTAKVAGFSNLRTEITGNRDNITRLTTELNQAKTEVSTINTTLTRIDTSLSSDYFTKNQLNPLLNDKVNLTDFNNLKATVDTKLDASALADYVKSSQLSTINNEINKLKTGKVDTNTFNTLSQTVTNIERDKADKTQIASITTEIQALKTDTVKVSDFNTYKTQVQNSLSSKLDASVENTLNQKINSKVSQEAHDRLANEVGLLSRGNLVVS